ncbi:hypothetical protein LX36DRAFT_746456 [Colletotrichum falcatum]|nr:hypothetical protein LX36DRAFT_746456 [Colletotrichum falcatum]
MQFSPVVIFFLGVAFSRSATAIPAAFADFDCTGKINDIFHPLQDAQQALDNVDAATQQAVSGPLESTLDLVENRFQDKREIFENPHQTDVDTLNTDIANMLKSVPNTAANFALISKLQEAQSAVPVMTNTCKIDTP